MTPIVVDAGVIIEIATFGDHAAQAREALAGLRPIAPAHALIEAAGVMRRLAAARRIDDDAASRVVQRVAAFPVRLYEMGPAEIAAAWRYRHNLTMADAAYVVIAEQLGVALLTLDQAFSAPPKPSCPVITL